MEDHTALGHKKKPSKRESRYIREKTTRAEPESSPGGDKF